jgi:ketosteroid isomerase-like protein
MTDPEMHAFAQEWEAAWNSHDLDRILTHYADDIRFSSRKAMALVGSGDILGKAALRAYWGKALAGQPDLAFRVVDVYLGHNMMVITYTNHRSVLAAETLSFGADGLVCRAAACHREI